MQRDLEIRGRSPRTVEAYLAAMAGLVRFYMRPPDQLTPEDINRYQHHLIRERGLSYSTLNVAVSAFRFFYQETLRVDWEVARVPYHRKPKRLPVILSRDELVRVFDAAGALMSRAIFVTIYGAGLRLSECLHLRVGDVNSGRMVLEVRAGKGAKDRYVPLSESLLRLLRAYWVIRRPHDILFPGDRPGKPLDASTVQKRFKAAVRRADISKRVTPHSLRHAFATHMLEDGVHVRALQRILGHSSLSTTTVYLHCTEEYMDGVKSPLDRLSVDGLCAGG
jgi:site-specific recombinase XerD